MRLFKRALAVILYFQATYLASLGVHCSAWLFCKLVANADIGINFYNVMVVAVAMAIFLPVIIWVVLREGNRRKRLEEESKTLN